MKLFKVEEEYSSVVVVLLGDYPSFGNFMEAIVLTNISIVAK
jgi:hypothetical protein